MALDCAGSVLSRLRLLWLLHSFYNVGLFPLRAGIDTWGFATLPSSRYTTSSS